MVDENTFAEIKNKIYDLIHIFFKDETTEAERKQIIEEVEKFPEHLSGALFGIIGWPYKFELDGKIYTLEYNTTYTLETFKSDYFINLYSGHDDNKELIQQESDTNKAKVFTRFLKLVDSIKKGNFNIENY